MSSLRAEESVRSYHIIFNMYTQARTLQHKTSAVASRYHRCRTIIQNLTVSRPPLPLRCVIHGASSLPRNNRSFVYPAGYRCGAPLLLLRVRVPRGGQHQRMEVETGVCRGSGSCHYFWPLIVPLSLLLEVHRIPLSPPPPPKPQIGPKSMKTWIAPREKLHFGQKQSPPPPLTHIKYFDVLRIHFPNPLSFVLFFLRDFPCDFCITFIMQVLSCK